MVELKDAEISECEKFRYTLSRMWDVSKPHLVWVMLNPSTADADTDDATIRRVRSFTKREGYGGFVVVNVFAYRATSPEDMHANRPAGDERNISTVQRIVHGRDVVVAWGNNICNVPEFQRVKMALERAHSVRCLGYTKGRLGVGGCRRIDKEPRHPVRLASSTPLEAWPLPDQDGLGESDG